MKFLEDPFSESRVPCGQTDGLTDRQTAMMRLTFAFQNSGHTPDQHM